MTNPTLVQLAKSEAKEWEETTANVGNAYVSGGADENCKGECVKVDSCNNSDRKSKPHMQKSEKEIKSMK